MRMLIFAILCVLACAVDPKLLQGSFFQPQLSVAWGKDGFDKEFKYMKDAQMDHVIWQWTVDSKNMLAWYPTSLPGYKQVTNFDAVEASLLSALKYNMTVWIGLNDNGDWWKYYGNNQTWLLNEFRIGKEVIKDMWSKYGTKYARAIAGFYVVFEVDNVFFPSERSQVRMASVYRDIANYCHSQTSKPLMVAPFFNQYWTKSQKMNAREYATFWHNILLVANIDIVAMQDGIGVEHTSLEDVATWFIAMRAGMKSARPESQLWTDLETFHVASDSILVPAAISRVIKQIQLETPYVSGITSFSFSHYNSPLQGFTKEYEEYMKYVRNHVRAE